MDKVWSYKRVDEVKQSSRTAAYSVVEIRKRKNSSCLSAMMFVFNNPFLISNYKGVFIAINLGYS